MERRYIVKGDHTLGYVLNPDFCPPGYASIGVLAGSVLRGGHDWKNGPTVAHHNELRDATPADFAAYRVLPPASLNQKGFAT